ncbi:MAG: nitroreductase family protein [Ignavibacteria bacterium]|nr:nitroreductase family protein [Ignavibacteria bacterium]
MEFSKVVEQRTSGRGFTREPVPEDILRQMVRITGMAPCIGGIEVWKFVAITNRGSDRKKGTCSQSQVR